MSSDLVELVPGSSVNIDRATLEKIKISSLNSTTLARNLARELFTDEELATHSLYGAR